MEEKPFGDAMAWDDLKLEFLRDKGRSQKFYHQLSRVYDTWLRDLFWTEEMRAFGLAAAGITPGTKVLDVGCGTGFLTGGALRITPHVEALDLSRDQLARARRKFRLDFVRGDAEGLPYRDATFDAVVSSGSIEYWPNPVVALREMRRVVKPGGRVMVGGPTKPRDPLYRLLANNMMLFYDEAEARAMFQEAALDEVWVGYTGPTWRRDLAIVTTGVRSP